MDVDKLIAELNAEIERIKGVVAFLEQLRGPSIGATEVSRRGRKSMDEAERREVSARMKKYWANRRRGKAFGDQPEELGRSRSCQQLEILNEVGLVEVSCLIGDIGPGLIRALLTKTRFQRRLKLPSPSLAICGSWAGMACYAVTPPSLTMSLSSWPAKLPIWFSPMRPTT
jgi:hypothetical protein